MRTIDDVGSGAHRLSWMLRRALRIERSPGVSRLAGQSRRSSSVKAPTSKVSCQRAPTIVRAVFSTSTYYSVMRYLLAMLFVGGAAGLASAQPSEAVVIAPPPPLLSTSGMWLDFGVSATRVDPGDGQTYRGQYVRFAPMTTIKNGLYLGAEIDIGSFDANQPVVADSAARGEGSSGTGTTMATDNSGMLAAAKLVAGVRMMAGSFSGGVELAGGIRYATITANDSLMSTYSSDAGVFEARGRLDLWLSPHLTVGALAGTDLARRDEVTFGLDLGFHFEPFDHSRY